VSATGLKSERLQRLARRAPPATAGAGVDAAEVCELCGVAVAPVHRHLVDIRSHQLLCCCRPCSLLFDRPAAAQGELRLVPDRRLRLAGFVLPEDTWARLGVPIALAFFIREDEPGRALAFYPSPLGRTQSGLDLTAWSEVEAANPVLATLAPAVEALLVNRTENRAGTWIVPIEDCYRLVAVIRGHWKGLSGGQDVWPAVDTFFAELAGRASGNRRSNG